MKELELTLTLRNNRLKERRDALGLTRGALAEAAGVRPWEYGALEALRASPLRRSGWSAAASKLAAFHGVLPEDLFPAAVLAVASPSAVRRIDVAEALALACEGSASPLSAVAKDEARRIVHDAVLRLPARDALVLGMRFGLGGLEERTLERIGAELGLSGQRVRSIERKALRALALRDSGGAARRKGPDSGELRFCHDAYDDDEGC